MNKELQYIKKKLFLSSHADLTILKFTIQLNITKTLFDN
jgi:hypothetical protein